jgi:hypothetical protein
MTHDAVAPSQTPSIESGGYILPLIASIVLTLVWGAYTIWVSLEIFSQAPRA